MQLTTEGTVNNSSHDKLLLKIKTVQVYYSNISTMSSAAIIGEEKSVLSRYKNKPITINLFLKAVISCF